LNALLIIIESWICFAKLLLILQLDCLNLAFCSITLPSPIIDSAKLCSAGQVLGVVMIPFSPLQLSFTQSSKPQLSSQLLLFFKQSLP